MGIVKIEYLAGSTMSECIEDARRIMMLLGCYVETNMNGVTVVIMGHETPAEEAQTMVIKKVGNDKSKHVVIV